MNAPLYYEDFAVNEAFDSAQEYVMEKDAAIAFAREFDPQPMHLEDGERNTLFGQLVASGWHTAAVTMRLKTQTKLVYGG
jgi:acyl dehydratase